MNQLNRVHQTRRGKRETLTADAIVVGTGVAGLAAALGLAPRRVILVTKAELGGGASSVWAQGGVAVAWDRSDSPELHAADTVAAGAGLVDDEIAALLARDGVAAIRKLIELGAEFDRGASGELALGREAAHSRRRILHAHGDATGAEMVRALALHVRRSPSIELHERTFVTALEVDAERRVVGVRAVDRSGRELVFRAPRVVVATGGLGQVYRFTTNPREATGDGLALAGRAGARLADVEFVQFHPTALATGGDPLPLLTEALRGEGATVVDESGARFLVAEHEAAELAPRDVVARGIWKRLAEGHRVYLDAREAVGARFPRRFPTVFASCRAVGIDPRSELMPVVPAAHYHMGGILVDEWGRASLDGLWACGEVAATGVHGANRLASNSLLEALVFGGRVAESAGALPSPRRLAVVERRSADGDVAAPRREPVDSTRDSGADSALRAELRDLAWKSIGLIREARELGAAVARLAAISAAGGLDPESGNLALVAGWIGQAALRRTESRGAHFRSDHPATDPAWKRRQSFVVDAERGGELDFEDFDSSAFDLAPASVLRATRAS